MNEEEPFADYVGFDLGGFMYNKKYPPNERVNGSHHHGYATDNQECFLYDVALYLYGIKFTYKGKHYWIPSDGEAWVLINEDDNTQSEPYDNPLDLIENAMIDGKHIIDILDEFEDLIIL